MKIMGCCALTLGIVGLGIAITGDTTRLGNYRVYAPKHWDTLDERVVQRIQSRADLVAEARARVASSGLALTDATLMNALYGVVIERFAHGAAEHTPFTNWVLWARGLPRSNAPRIRDTNDLLRRGHNALCGQVSQLLADTARESGIDARLIQLEGHVVMEAYFDGEWHLYDADAEVGPSGLSDRFPSLESVIRTPTRVEALYRANNPQMIPLILSVEDNSIGDLDPGRLRNERITTLAKYLIPILFVALGFATLWRKGPSVRRTSS